MHGEVNHRRSPSIQQKRRRCNGRAFTRLDFLTFLAMSGVVAAVAFSAAPPPATQVNDPEGQGKQTRMRTLKDATQLGQIHKAMVIFAHDNKDTMPRPGLIDRQPTDVGGRKMNVPGRGEEDTSANTTANLYASLVAMNYFTPKLIISPVERNPKVTADDDYNYDAYNPVEDSYWDHSFTADLADGSNVSYAHLVMTGERMHLHWRNTMDAQFIVLGNRGPAAGEINGRSYTSGPHGSWSGNVIFSDNHSEFISSFTPDSLKNRHAENAAKSDNIFAMEGGAAGGDCIISFTKADNDDGPVLQHD